MDIVLDSNIYRSDFQLRSNDFDILLDYLKRTGSGILFPEIILDEVTELYKRTLTERISNHNKSVSNINLVIIDKERHLENLSIDIDKETENYIKYLKKRLGTHDRHILKPKDNYLKEISSRAIKRVKPCGNDGQGFRDALIWLSIKDYTQTSKEKQIGFISNNDKDFSNSDKTDLHESLIKECEEIGIKINYFKSVRDFIEKLSIKIDFITEDWLSESIDYDQLNDYVSDVLNSTKSREVKEWLAKDRRLDHNYYVENYKVLSVNTYNLTDYFVYEMIDGTYVVSTTMAFEAEIEFDFYNRDEFERGFEYSPYSYGRTRNDYKYLDSEVYVSFTIQDKAIVDVEIEDIYISTL